MRVDNLWNNSYIKKESSGERNKILSVKEYLDKIKIYTRDIIINLQKSYTWKIQLTIAITLFLLMMMLMTSMKSISRTRRTTI